MTDPHKYAYVFKAWADGAKIQAFTFGDWHDEKHPVWPGQQEWRVKPAPPLPVTRMTGAEILILANQIADKSGGCISPLSYPGLMVEIANAAIRRAIEDGDVILPSQE